MTGTPKTLGPADCDARYIAVRRKMREAGWNEYDPDGWREWCQREGLAPVAAPTTYDHGPLPTRETCPCGETRDDFGACWKCDRPRVPADDEPIRSRVSGVCVAHGSWVSATAEGCPTCVMLTQGRYCARHILGGRASREKCAICGRIAANDAAYRAGRAADDERPSPRDDSWVRGWNEEQGR